MYSIKVTKDNLNAASLDDLFDSMEALDYFCGMMEDRGEDSCERYYEYASLFNAVSAEIERRGA